jgi:hypothetical protein
MEKNIFQLEITYEEGATTVTACFKDDRAKLYTREIGLKKPLEAITDAELIKELAEWGNTLAINLEALHGGFVPPSTTTNEPQPENISA